MKKIATLFSLIIKSLNNIVLYMMPTKMFLTIDHAYILVRYLLVNITESSFNFQKVS